jgi:transposase
MKSYIRIGIDIAKNYFQVHAIEREGQKPVRRKLSRAAILSFLEEVQPTEIGLEACGSAHHWARRFQAMGHRARIIPPSYVKAYVKRGKNDAVDAEAICEAMSRPGMRFVAVKTEGQQAMLMAHKTRDLLVKQRTMAVNAARAHLAEFGVVVAKGIDRLEELAEKARGIELPAMAIAMTEMLFAHLRELDEKIGVVGRQITAADKENALCRLIASAPGVGPLAASAIVASVPDPHVFASGRDFAAWLGVTPRQNSTGGKTKLGAITKQGNHYIRRLLTLGAIAMLRWAPTRKGPLRDWLVKLMERKPYKVAAIALVNKLARIVWAMMITGEHFREEIFAKA